MHEWWNLANHSFYFKTQENLFNKMQANTAAAYDPHERGSYFTIC